MKKLLLFIFLSLSVWADMPLSSVLSATNSPFKKILDEVYTKNNGQPFWTGENRTEQLNTLLDLLEDPYLNYKNKPFNRPEIENLLDQIGSDIQPLEAKKKLDMALTDGYLMLLKFVRTGDVDWSLVKRKMVSLKAKQDVRAKWEITTRGMPSSKQIFDSLKSGKIEQFVYSQVPQIHRYKLLIKMLDKYREMPKIGKIPYGKMLKPHSFDDRLRLIKKRLHFFGDYPNSDTGSGWSSEFTKAVRSFKQRLNLTKGDYIDNKVILYLNKPRSSYIKKIITNLDILKLYPRSFESEYAEVNVPDFQVRYYRGGKIALKSPIVVGRIDRPTPIFADKIEYMVLNPTWTITDNLVRRDLIPVLRKDPNYLQEHNIHVFQGTKEVPLDFARLAKAEHGGPVPYRFVQYPGDKNALGRVKFMFPNKYAVYLHDTDNHSLFKYRYRVFSSGCMRVAKPFDLMNILLGHAKGNYSQTKIEQIFATNKPTTIKLAKPIPVHILYNTVYHEKGKDYFLYDIYMYEQMIYESSAGHTRPTFTVPKKRLTGIKRVSRIRR